MLRLFILGCVALTLAGQTAGVVSVTDFGAHSDGTGAEDTTAAFLQAFTANPGGEIDVPPGDYLLDNRKGAVAVNQFSGLMSFAGAARLVFLDNTKGGLWFYGGTGARIQGLRATYQTPPAKRNSPEEEIKFSDTTDTMVTDAVVGNSPSAGMLFYHCIRPKVTNIVIRDTMADGLHFANCKDVEASNVTTNNTGDDGLAFLNYSVYEDLNGGLAYNVSVRNSKSRGISVIGQSNVTISNFQVDGTASSGILCAYDVSYKTRVPHDVQFSSGTILNAGVSDTPVGNNYGIEYNGQQSCSFSGIQITGSAGRGVGGFSPNGSVQVRNVTVSQNLSNEAFSFYQTATVNVSGSTADTTPSYGFYFGQCGTVVATNLTARRTALKDPLRRPIWFEANQLVMTSGLVVVDP